MATTTTPATTIRTFGDQTGTGASPLQRLLAKGIDVFVILACAELLPTLLGGVIALSYALLADGIHFKGLKGQSLGKRLLGITVWSLKGHHYGTYKDSIIRNLSFGIATFLMLLPVVGWVLFPLIGVPLIAIEIYLLFRVEGNTRLGDVMADTVVILEPQEPAP